MTSNDDSFQLDTEQSPSRAKSRPQSRGANHGTSDSKSKQEAEQSREEALRQELASVKKVNEAIEGVLQSLEKPKANMKVGKRRAMGGVQQLTSARQSTVQSALPRNC